MSFNDHREFWTEFVNLYRSMRPLWDARCKEYVNKHVKREKFEILVEKAREKFPHADVDFVKKKIESLRASFRRELRRMRTSQKKAGTSNPVYEPSLWYFDLLLFTADSENAKEGPRSRKNKLEREDRGREESEEDTEDFPNMQPITEVYVPDTFYVPNPLSSTTSAPGTCRAYRKRRLSDIKQEQSLDPAIKVLSNQKRSEVFAHNIALQLEELEYHQRAIAEKLIADVIFYAKMNRLTVMSPSQAPFFPVSPFFQRKYPEDSNPSQNVQTSAAAQNSGAQTHLATNVCNELQSTHLEPSSVSNPQQVSKIAQEPNCVPSSEPSMQEEVPDSLT